MLAHLDAAYNLARWLLGNDEDAEDAVQESCLKAFRGYATMRGEQLKPWFLTIVRNSCMNSIRTRNRKRGAELNDEDVLQSLVDRTVAPDRAVEAAYDSENLRAAIEKLPESWREVIILREFEQMSYKELAEVTAVPIGTVMSRLARAREKLHVLLLTEVAHEL